VSAGEAAALIGALAAVVAAGALVFGFVQLVRTLGALRLSVEELRRNLPPPERGPERVRSIPVDDRPEPVPTTGGVPSRPASLAFPHPAIKAVALASGTARAVKVLRHR
jgi:hypothetical protein